MLLLHLTTGAAMAQDPNAAMFAAQLRAGGIVEIDEKAYKHLAARRTIRGTVQVTLTPPQTVLVEYLLCAEGDEPLTIVWTRNGHSYARHTTRNETRVLCDECGIDYPDA